MNIQCPLFLNTKSVPGCQENTKTTMSIAIKNLERLDTQVFSFSLKLSLLLRAHRMLYSAIIKLSTFQLH